MSDSAERRRILDLLAKGLITAREAEELLNALGESPHQPASEVGSRTARPAPGAPTARSIRIRIDEVDGQDEPRAKVNVTIPLGLARFASKLIPRNAQLKLEEDGIDISALIAAIDEHAEEGRLVEMATESDGSGKSARITVDIV